MERRDSGADRVPRHHASCTARQERNGFLEADAHTISDTRQPRRGTARHDVLLEQNYGNAGATRDQYWGDAGVTSTADARSRPQLSDEPSGSAARDPVLARKGDRVAPEIGGRSGGQAMLLEAVPGQNVLIDGLLGAGKDDPRLRVATDQFARDGDGGKEVSAAAAAGEEIGGVRGQGSGVGGWRLERGFGVQECARGW
jgi:hypothetical protein